MFVTLKIDVFPDREEYYPRRQMKIICESEDIQECERVQENFFKNHLNSILSKAVIIPKEVIMNPVSLKTIEKEDKILMRKRGIRTLEDIYRTDPVYRAEVDEYYARNS